MILPFPRAALALVASVLLCVGSPAAASAWTLDAATWARPRSGAAILTMGPIPQVVQSWSQQSAERIVIHHPGGEDGEIWAAELRAWLIALGVPGSRVELVGGGEPERLNIALR